MEGASEDNASGLSMRGWSNVGAIMPKIRGAVAERSRLDNPNIDLATAENWLIRDEIINIYKDAIAKDLEPIHFSYPRAFAGFPEVLDALSRFFNAYFEPSKPVEVSHLATAPGAASCLDTLLYNICDPGEGVLVPGPYWSGFDFQFKARSSVKPISVVVDKLADNVTEALLPALEKAYEHADCLIKALVITNPHNPFAQCYPRHVLEQCVGFCQRKGIHYVSDEVYALTHFQCEDLTDIPFVSALNLDIEGLGCDRSRIHTVWSPSKDFGQSGVRMGCTVTQANPEMAVGCALASNTQTSSLSAICVSKLLASPDLPKLIELNSKRLAEAYRLLTTVLKRHQIRYIPCNAGPYLFAQIDPNARTWEHETGAIATLKDEGVIVSSGRSYHGPENTKGWARIGFAVDNFKMKEACRRLDGAFSRMKRDKE
ncbi:MAG: hypothetical protein Q9165_008261 [Trypethelium subeluteriae]